MKMTCTKCKKEFPVRNPGIPGLYKVVCTNPECRHSMTLQIRAREIKMEAGRQQPPQQPAANQDTPPKMTFLGTPAKTEKGIYLLKTPLRMGEKVAYTCPVCGKKLATNPQKVGVFSAPCPACKTSTTFRVVDPNIKPATDEVPSANTRRIPPLNEIKGQKAKLVWGCLIERIFHYKEAVLKDGITWVGRNEPSNPSDVMINDPAVSAHSFFIERESETGNMKLTVHHATNPVTVNGVECKEGCSVYLKFNDKIKTGTTTLVVDKVK